MCKIYFLEQISINTYTCPFVSLIAKHCEGINIFSCSEFSHIQHFSIISRFSVYQYQFYFYGYSKHNVERFFWTQYFRYIDVLAKSIPYIFRYIDTFSTQNFSLFWTHNSQFIKTFFYNRLFHHRFFHYFEHIILNLLKLLL